MLVVEPREKLIETIINLKKEVEECKLEVQCIKDTSYDGHMAL